MCAGLGGNGLLWSLQWGAGWLEAGDPLSRLCAHMDGRLVVSSAKAGGLISCWLLIWASSLHGCLRQSDYLHSSLGLLSERHTRTRQKLCDFCDQASAVRSHYFWHTFKPMQIHGARIEVLKSQWGKSQSYVMKKARGCDHIKRYHLPKMPFLLCSLGCSAQCLT